MSDRNCGGTSSGALTVVEPIQKDCSAAHDVRDMLFL
jgi:hypothetical protein